MTIGRTRGSQISHPSSDSHPCSDNSRPSSPDSCSDPKPCPNPRPPPAPCKCACAPFKNLGKISDYKELFDALSQFRVWKDGVLGPLVESLGTNYQQLLGTNCVLHQIAELVTDSVEHRDLDQLMHKVDGQLRVMGMHLKTLRDGPAKLRGFKCATMKKMSHLQARYATTFKLMQPLSRHVPPTPRAIPQAIPRFRQPPMPARKDRSSSESHEHTSRRRHSHSLRHRKHDKKHKRWKHKKHGKNKKNKKNKKSKKNRKRKEKKHKKKNHKRGRKKDKSSKRH